MKKTELKCTSLSAEKSFWSYETTTVLSLFIQLQGVRLAPSELWVSEQIQWDPEHSLSLLKWNHFLSIHLHERRQQLEMMKVHNTALFINLVENKLLFIHIHHFGDTVSFLKHAFLLQTKKQDLELISRHPTVLEIKLVSWWLLLLCAL